MENYTQSSIWHQHGMLDALKLPKLSTTAVVTSIFALLLILSWSAEPPVASPQVGKLSQEQQ